MNWLNVTAIVCAMGACAAALPLIWRGQRSAWLLLVAPALLLALNAAIAAGVVKP
jgi:hypothetical protein